ncbi:MAG: FAD binding domain-containing protein [Dethiobacteria bacterium]|jgi:carbon-monoxide dehydrogenase medium subunit
MIGRYYKPANLEEALAILNDCRGKARVIAGGTDLILQLMRKEIVVDAVVDIANIKQLRFISEDETKIRVGALSTHTDLAESSLIRKKAPLLSDAAGSIGSLQIRNAGTVGGNIVNAQPAADTAVALLALDATVKIISISGEKRVPLAALYHPGGGASLDPCSEILTEIIFIPLEEDKAAGVFSRLARRKAVALPVFNTAVTIWSGEDKSCLSDVRIAMGPVARVPFRAREAEKFLQGSSPGKNIFQLAAGIAADEAAPRDSQYRGSAVYRKKIARVMVFRALSKAWEMIANTGV